MSFPEFLAAIREPALIPVAQHWNAVRAERAMPCWRDIDPAELRHQLPIVWAWRWDGASGDFIGRLAGQDIELAMGRSTRGRSMQEMFGDPAAAILRARYRDIMCVPEMSHSIGSIFSRLRQSGSAERIVLPLAPDENSDGGVFGATVYRLGLAAQNEGIIFDQERETRRTFSL